jgi:hypothetical protein
MEIRIYNYYNVQKNNCELWAYRRLMESYYITTFALKNVGSIAYETEIEINFNMLVSNPRQQWQRPQNHTVFAHGHSLHKHFSNHI